MLPATPKESEPSSLVPDKTCRHFSLDEIRAATENFNEELVVGRGGFGKVYKCQINHGSATIVAIKRLNSNSNQGAPEFRAEVETLSKLRHCNLVSLIGYCNEGVEMILVYDYMPHGTLEDSLHKDGVHLSWLQRLKICIGAARGLDYLHTGTGTQHGVIHRDVKSSNILLDENFAAKISDFGLAKIGPTNQTLTYVSTGVKGTFGYMDPCYFYTGKLTRKSDVYAFGVVLLEVICGKRAVDSSLDEDQWGLAIWAQDRIKEGKLNRITDSRLGGQISSDCLKQFTRIACRCLRNQPNQRPTMADIIVKLELILSLQVKLDSPVTDRKFTDKLRWFFPSKVQQKANMAAPTASREGEPSDKAADRLIHFDGSLFRVEDLLQASAEVIGKSDYWIRYKLMLLESCEQVWVRRMKTELFLTEDIFLAKIHALGKLCHPNILGPKAYYHGNGETLYITDSKQNGSISSFLHTNSNGQLPKPLDWSTRRSIIVGITRGLVYLHTQENIGHGYLTSENVLLDRNYNPFIVDVGLLLLLNRDARPKSPLNHAPELLKFQDANMKTDVYGLGLIMLELLTRKSANSEKEGIGFLAWVKSIPGEGFRAEVFDPELKSENSDIKQELVRILDLAMECVSLSPDARPTADQVLQQLESDQVYLPSTTITGN